MLTSCILQLSHNCKVMPLLLNILFRWLQIFFQGSSTFFFFFSWLESPSAVVLEPEKIQSVTVSISPHVFAIWHEVIGPVTMIFIFFNVEIWARFFTLLFFSSADSLVILHFLSYMWCQEHIWGYWYFSRQSWFLFGFHPAWHCTQCALNIS